MCGAAPGSERRLGRGWGTLCLWSQLPSLHWYQTFLINVTYYLHMDDVQGRWVQENRFLSARQVLIPCCKLLNMSLNLFVPLIYWPKTLNFQLWKSTNNNSFFSAQHDCVGDLLTRDKLAITKLKMLEQQMEGQEPSTLILTSLIQFSLLALYPPSILTPSSPLTHFFISLLPAPPSCCLFKLAHPFGPYPFVSPY